MKFYNPTEQSTHNQGKLKKKNIGGYIRETATVMWEQLFSKPRMISDGILSF